MNHVYAYPQVTFLGQAGSLRPPAPQPQGNPASPVPQRDLVRASLVLRPATRS
jgi:hypothetical protein